jgi:hypothetical protein
MRRRCGTVLAGLVVMVLVWASTAGASGSPANKPAKPTVFTKMTKSTQDLWYKTKDALTPGSKAAKKPGGHATKTPSMLDKMRSWFQPEKEDMTVEAWELLPMPGIER